MATIIFLKQKGFPKEMALRPSQIRASAAETGLMIPDAFAQRDLYANLKMPVVIIAGDEDKLIDIETQSAVSLRRRPPSIDFVVRDSCLKSGSMIVSTIS